MLYLESAVNVSVVSQIVFMSVNVLTLCLNSIVLIVLLKLNKQLKKPKPKPNITDSTKIPESVNTLVKKIAELKLCVKDLKIKNQKIGVDK